MRLTAREPLVITSGSAESMAHECLSYIPGNMLLGALAYAWKRANPREIADSHPDFIRLFLNGDVSWGHAYPLCEGEVSVPIPISYIHEKSLGHLPTEGSAFSREEHWICNLLALNPDETAELYWKKSHPDKAFKKRKIAAGFMCPATLHSVGERTVFNVHIALGKARSALESQLYGYSALGRGLIMESHILCHKLEVWESLLALCGGTRSLHVGHARSAGYERVDLEISPAENATEMSAPKTSFNLFLLSQFIPNPSWQEPYESLRKEVEKLAGCPPAIESVFSGVEEIQAYNGLWNRPRTSRAALRMGSCLKISFPEPVSLPARFAIGGFQLEGYGRILLDPPFLRKAVPDIGPAIPAATAPDPAPSPASGENAMLWKILLGRAADRQLNRQIDLWLHKDEWKKFLDDASRLDRPTASQRNNLRDMDLAAFREMLAKSPGEQWKQATAFCPFTGRKDHLSQIVEKLLDPANFRHWTLDPLKLPMETALSRLEQDQLAARAHKLFIRQFVSLWNKLSRIPEKE